MLGKKPIVAATFFLSAVLASAGMLSLYQTACAQQQRGNPLPFANPVEQRNEMVRELKEIKDLLREQNTLLRTLVNHAEKSAANSNPQAGGR